WVDVYVPQGTPAGLYKGTAQVTIGSTVAAKIPVQLTVRDFDLPSVPTLKTAYSVGMGEAASGHYGTRDISDTQYWELICLYTKEMLLHRLSNSNVIWPAPAWNSSLGKINWSLPAVSTSCNQRYPEFLTGGNPNLLPNGKLPNAKVSRARLRDGMGLSTTDVESVAYYRDYTRHIADMGWKSQIFYYLWDEAPYPLVGGVRRCDQTYSGAATTAWSGLYKKARYFKDNAIDVPLMVTSSRQATDDCFINYLKVPDYTQYIDIWTVPNIWMNGKPTTNFPFNANLRGSYDAIITPGKALLWYQACGNQGCNGSETGYPSPMVDLPAIYSRAYEWLTYQYQIGHTAPGPSTELYFETLYAYAWPSNDPWKNLYYYTGNGDGTYFYPGRPDKIGGTHHIPIPSIRLKMLREGIEDYEYLTLAAAKKDGQGIDGQAWVKANILNPYMAAVDPADGVSKLATYIWNKNPGSPTSATGLLRAREELAKALSSTTPLKPDFSVTAASSSAVAGNSSASNISISSVDGFHGTVNLTCAPSDPTLTCRFTSSSLAVPSDGRISTSMTVGTQGSTPVGTYSIVVKGVSGTLVHQITSTLTVQGSGQNVSYGDNFDRASATGLGNNWNDYLPRFEIFNNQARNETGTTLEALFTPVIGPDQSVAVDCKLTVSGNGCGVMARWSNADNFYYAMVDVGQQNLTLFKNVGGTPTPLATAKRAMSYNSYYRVRLVAKGSTLSVYFAAETGPAILLTDASLSFGNYAGIRSYANATATTWFDNFVLTTP
ncbi:MAG: DUF4091 domain-containing protein, partial [Nitrospirae bacterium]|nr:DUF4091 domain-containing protein [Candidatus Manganitrophaceae bacterium]